MGHFNCSVHEELNSPMNEAPAVLLDFGALFARKSDSQIVKVGLDRTMFLNEAVNNSFEENAVGEHFVIEHQIETTISTIQEKFYRNSYGEEPGAFDLLPFRGVLAEISERCAGKLAVVSSPLLPPECTELLDEYELTNTVIPLVSQIKDGVTGTLLTRYRKLIDWNIITLTFISDFGNACAQIKLHFGQRKLATHRRRQRSGRANSWRSHTGGERVECAGRHECNDS